MRGCPLLASDLLMGRAAAGTRAREAATCARTDQNQLDLYLCRPLQVPVPSHAHTPASLQAHVTLAARLQRQACLEAAALNAPGFRV